METEVTPTASSQTEVFVQSRICLGRSSVARLFSVELAIVFLLFMVGCASSHKVERISSEPVDPQQFVIGKSAKLGTVKVNAIVFEGDLDMYSGGRSRVCSAALVATLKSEFKTSGVEFSILGESDPKSDQSPSPVGVLSVEIKGRHLQYGSFLNLVGYFLSFGIHPLDDVRSYDIAVNFKRSDSERTFQFKKTAVVTISASGITQNLAFDEQEQLAYQDLTRPIVDDLFNGQKVQ